MSGSVSRTLCGVRSHCDQVGRRWIRCAVVLSHSGHPGAALGGFCAQPAALGARRARPGRGGCAAAGGERLHPGAGAVAGPLWRLRRLRKLLAPPGARLGPQPALILVGSGERYRLEPGERREANCAPLFGLGSGIFFLSLSLLSLSPSLLTIATNASLTKMHPLWTMGQPSCSPRSSSSSPSESFQPPRPVLASPPEAGSRANPAQPRRDCADPHVGD